MNKEVQQFLKTAALLNPAPVIPSESEIQEAITLIEEKFENKAINRTVNAGVKEGYMAALKVLLDNIKDFNLVNASELKTIQGRAIAAIAVDFLNGTCPMKTLCGVSVKEK